MDLVQDSTATTGGPLALSRSMPQTRSSSSFHPWPLVLSALALPLRVLSWLADVLFPRVSVRVLRSFGQKGRGGGGQTGRLSLNFPIVT